MTDYDFVTFTDGDLAVMDTTIDPFDFEMDEETMRVFNELYPEIDPPF